MTTKVPTPELWNDDQSAKCTCCGVWSHSGYWYDDQFLCPRCIDDGDALALVAYRLAFPERRDEVQEIEDKLTTNALRAVNAALRQPPRATPAQVAAVASPF